jgi:hypothetical protein
MQRHPMTAIRRSFNIAPGIRINSSKSGVGTLIGAVSAACTRLESFAVLIPVWQHRFAKSDCRLTP